MKKLAAVLLSVLMLAGLLAACGGGGGTSSGSTPPASGSGDTPSTVAQDLVYAVGEEPAGLDPHLTTAHASIRVHKNIYSRLITQVAGGALEGDLATDWTMSDDGLEYVFNLRQGVKFHNGREMTAADVVYSYERMMDEDVGSVARNYFLTVDSVVATDDYTVTFTMKNPDATFLGYVASNYAAIVPQEVVEENGDLKAVACGTGPFMLKEYVEGSQIVLEKNPDYFLEGLPKLDSVTYLIMTDEAARLAALRTGTAHIASLPSSNLPLVEGNADISVLDYLTPNYDYLGFDLESEPFSDVRVRQAISLLIDREEYAQTIYEGNAEPCGPVSPAMGNYALGIANDPYYANDLDAALALLEEAGYADGFTMTITAGINQETINGAQLLKSQIERGGATNITVEIDVMERAQYIDAWREFAGSGRNTMIGMNGFGSDPDRSLTFFFNSSSSANVWGYSNARIDELGAEGKVA
ncbi:ABC transporter substrate-binding protein, partial [Ruminococcaceae bacterium OttesenSCG-928-O06]|nr:ABC transporter substrate-binding protein [Ruminococcaceae bacterium OttesenSCG-928-O06]